MRVKCIKKFLGVDENGSPHDLPCPMVGNIYNSIEEGDHGFFLEEFPIFVQYDKQKFEKVISTLKKPKTDAELESMISKIESDAQQIKEQIYGPSWLMPTIMIAGALFILVVLIIGLKNFTSGLPDIP